MVSNPEIKPFLDHCGITRDIDNESAIGPLWKKTTNKGNLTPWEKTFYNSHGNLTLSKIRFKIIQCLPPNRYKK